MTSLPDMVLDSKVIVGRDNIKNVITFAKSGAILQFDVKTFESVVLLAQTTKSVNVIFREGMSTDVTALKYLSQLVSGGFVVRA